MTDIVKAYGDAAEKMLEFVETRTTDQAAGTLSVPVSDYLDADRWQKEVALIFNKLPLMLALSVELPEINDYKAMDVMGRPVLIARGKDGRTELQNFKITGDDIAIEGWIALDAKNQMKAFYFPEFTLNVITSASRSKSAA